VGEPRLGSYALLCGRCRHLVDGRVAEGSDGD
jgi:hypothetical protein